MLILRDELCHCLRSQILPHMDADQRRFSDEPTELLRLRILASLFFICVDLRPSAAIPQLELRCQRKRYSDLIRLRVGRAQERPRKGEHPAKVIPQ